MLDHLQLNAVALCCLTSRFAGIALIHVRKRHALAGQFLYRMRQLLDLFAILLIGRCHMQCQQLTQSIDRQMHFRTLAALRAVVAGACTGFRCRLQCAAVQDHGTRLRFASIAHAQQFSQIMHDRLETARSHPALRLLIDRFPRGQVIRQHAPRRAASDQPAQRIEDLAKLVAALFTVFSHQRQIRHNERPFFVAYIARIRLAGFHPDILPYQRQSS
ncbi:hypothetical protein WJ84_13970 [Burkholderia ubonensis]|nr:hypothetical protein WJ84_13970 [Burkholderia ubonensis]